MWMEEYSKLWRTAASSMALWLLSMNCRTCSPWHIQKDLRWYIDSTPESWGEEENGKEKKTLGQICRRIRTWPLEIGDKVVVQDPKTSTWLTKGIVHGKLDNGRSYIIDFAEGGRQIHNRRQIWPDIGTSGHVNENVGQKNDTSKNGTYPTINNASKDQSIKSIIEDELLFFVLLKFMSHTKYQKLWGCESVCCKSGFYYKFFALYDLY